VGAIERGERNITMATLERIAIALGVEAIALLRETTERRTRRP
jgi:transcriptional regulator with XRE-family HTH domain